MSEQTSIQDRLDAIKGPEPDLEPTTDSTERDMIILQASRIEATGVALRESYQKGEAAMRERSKELEFIFHAKHEALLKGVREALALTEQQHEKAFEKWGQSLTELESTNRLLAKMLIFFAVVFMGLFGLELFG